MRAWILAAVTSAALHSAVIRGTVVESQSGKALSRATVIVEPVPGSPGQRMTAHTDIFGMFALNEPAGTYLLQASRDTFYPAQYGQKRWNSAGMPLVLTEENPAFITIRLLRYGAITGRVVDENDVGMPEFGVSALLDARPPQSVATAVADERGNYRIYGLLPGNYVIRSMGQELEGVGYKLTYARDTDAIEEARSVGVQMEQESSGVTLRPLEGKLYNLSVTAYSTDPLDMPVTLTIASESGRQIVQAPSHVAHVFPNLPPGDYDVFAQALSDTRGVQSNYQRISLKSDASVSLTLRKTPAVGFTLEGAGGDPPPVWARRKDLAGTYDMRTITDGTAYLAAGGWEFAIPPSSGYYAVNFSGSGAVRRRPHPEGWNEALVSVVGGQERFTLATQGASLSGLVKDRGEPVIGAPVFLEPLDVEPSRRIAPDYLAITDMHGRYQFAALAPGRYRVLSSFEYQMPDPQIMSEAGAKELLLDAHGGAAADLDLYVIR